MTIDYTKLLEKLDNRVDGEDPLRIRVAVVSAVNANGTVDLVISGVTVPGVPRLSESVVQVGAVVQVLSQRGGLLVLGSVAGTTSSAGLGLWANGRSNSSSGPFGGTLAAVLGTNTVTFMRNRAYEVKTHGGWLGPSGAVVDVRVYRNTGVQLGEWYRFPITNVNAMNGTAGGIYFTVSDAGNVSGAAFLYASVSSGTATHFANSGQERNIEVWDVGQRSQFPSAPTW